MSFSVGHETFFFVFFLFDNKWETSTLPKLFIPFRLEQQIEFSVLFVLCSSRDRFIVDDPSSRSWDVVHTSAITTAWAWRLPQWCDHVTEWWMASIENNPSTAFRTLVWRASSLLHSRGPERTLNWLLLSWSIVQRRRKCDRRVSLHSTNATRKRFAKMPIEEGHFASLRRLRKNAHDTSWRKTPRTNTEDRSDLSDHHRSTAVLRTMWIRRNKPSCSTEHVQ